jgi:ABC-type molybdate transport system permease subunit
MRFSLWYCVSQPGLATAATLGFAHTVGEFGVVLMIGGNIPAKPGGVCADLTMWKAWNTPRYGWRYAAVFPLLCCWRLFGEKQRSGAGVAMIWPFRAVMRRFEL